MSDVSVHMHIWTDGNDDPEELDLEPGDIYGSLLENGEFDPTDDTTHVQYSCTLADGRGVELRLPWFWLTEEAKQRILNS